MGDGDESRLASTPTRAQSCVPRPDKRTVGITNLNLDRVLRAVLNEGLIAVVPGNFPVEKLLEIGDALLAAPLLVMEVTLDSSESLDAIALLRTRFGEHMLVGAGSVDNVDQFDRAIDAGAQFTASHVLDMTTIERALERYILHMPYVLNTTEIDVASRGGCKMVRLLSAELFGHTYRADLREQMGGVLFVPSGDIGPDNIGDYVRAGAACIALGTGLVTDPQQPMDDLITRARKYRAARLSATS